MPLSIGDRLGPYEILSPIGAGGMGDVYKARDPRLDRTVALKVSKAEFSERFSREARTVAQLNHPYICTQLDAGPNYLVMELVERCAPQRSSAGGQGAGTIRRINFTWGATSTSPLPIRFIHSSERDRIVAGSRRPVQALELRALVAHGKYESSRICLGRPIECRVLTIVFPVLCRQCFQTVTPKLLFNAILEETT